MATGRVDRQRRRRRGEGPAVRRFDRVRRGSAPASGKRPGAQAAWARSTPGTGGAFQMSSTRRAAVLAILVCATALSVSVPLRTYLGQRDELASQQQHHQELAKQVQELQQRKQALSDPAHFESEARKRLGYVRPGETPYIVQVPDTPSPGPSAQAQAPPASPAPWYSELWNSVSGGGS